MKVQIFSTLRGMEMKEWIRAARTHAQLTQEQLAERLGLTKGNISAWENGRHEASHDQLIKLASITSYTEPLPGLAQPVGAVMVDWPFDRIDEEKVRRLTAENRAVLERVVLGSAIALGLDIKKDG